MSVTSVQIKSVVDKLRKCRDDGNANAAKLLTLFTEADPEKKGELINRFKLFERLSKDRLNSFNLEEDPSTVDWQKQHDKDICGPEGFPKGSTNVNRKRSQNASKISLGGSWGTSARSLRETKIDD